MESIKDESRKLGVKIIGNNAAEALLELGQALTRTGEELMTSDETWKLVKGGLKHRIETAPCVCPERQFQMTHTPECQKADAAFEAERIYFWVLLKTGEGTDGECSE